MTYPDCLATLGCLLTPSDKLTGCLGFPGAVLFQPCTYSLVYADPVSGRVLSDKECAVGKSDDILQYTVHSAIEWLIVWPNFFFDKMALIFFMNTTAKPHVNRLWDAGWIKLSTIYLKPLQVHLFGVHHYLKNLVLAFFRTHISEAVLGWLLIAKSYLKKAKLRRNVPIKEFIRQQKSIEYKTFWFSRYIANWFFFSMTQQ